MTSRQLLTGARSGSSRTSEVPLAGAQARLSSSRLVRPPDRSVDLFSCLSYAMPVVHVSPSPAPRSASPCLTVFTSSFASSSCLPALLLVICLPRIDAPASRRLCRPCELLRLLCPCVPFTRIPTACQLSPRRPPPDPFSRPNRSLGGQELLSPSRASSFVPCPHTTRSLARCTLDPHRDRLTPRARTRPLLHCRSVTGKDGTLSSFFFWTDG